MENTIELTQDFEPTVTKPKIQPAPQRVDKIIHLPPEAPGTTVRVLYFGEHVDQGFPIPGCVPDICLNVRIGDKLTVKDYIADRLVRVTETEIV